VTHPSAARPLTPRDGVRQQVNLAGIDRAGNDQLLAAGLLEDRRTRSHRLARCAILGDRRPPAAGSTGRCRIPGPRRWPAAPVPPAASRCRSAVGRGPSGPGRPARRPPSSQRACQQLAVCQETQPPGDLGLDRPCWNRRAACRRRGLAAWSSGNGGGLEGVVVAMTIASQQAKPANVTLFYEPLYLLY
jgi:hypothetical protein